MEIPREAIELSLEREIDRIDVKRSLGDGHWDKKLIANMVELSIADNYC